MSPNAAPGGKTVEGGCLCGTVRFAFDLPTLWCAHCHCTMCRRHHGAGIVTWTGVAEDRFRVTAGGDSLNWHASSPGAERGFCRRCGSSMLFRSCRWPGEVHIALGTLDGPIDRAPQAHVFYSTHVDWLPVADDLPRQG